MSDVPAMIQAPTRHGIEFLKVVVETGMLNIDKAEMSASSFAEHIGNYCYNILFNSYKTRVHRRIKPSRTQRGPQLEEQDGLPISENLQQNVKLKTHFEAKSTRELAIRYSNAFVRDVDRR